MVKENSLTGKAIESWCLYNRIAIDSRMGPSPVIGNGEENIGWLDWFLLTSGNKQDQHSRDKEEAIPEKLSYFHVVKIVNLSILSSDPVRPGSDLLPMWARKDRHYDRS